jgi:predicted dehydrogenase
MSDLRVGLIGVGWGAHVQAPAFRSVPGYDLVALCARTDASVERAGAALGIGDLSTDWRSFVQRDDLDVVSVATPVHLHHDQVLAALAAGKHVLCEKPLALTVDDGAEMVAAAAASRRSTALSFEVRWQRERHLVRELVDAGVVGTPYSVRLHQSAPYWHPTRKLQSLWMYDLAAGGGYLNGLVVHDIDFVCSLFGEPVAVCADVRVSVPQRALPDGGTLDVTADDTSTVMLRLDSGALAVLTSSVVGLHARGYSFDAFGSQGTITLSGLAGSAAVRAGTTADDWLTERALSDAQAARLPDVDSTTAGGLIRSMALMLQDWLPSFDGQTTQSVPTFADGLRAHRVIEAARASSAGAGWVELR